jgi:hypothetical protein
MQGDSGRKLNILGDGSVGRCEEKVHMNKCLIVGGCRDTAFDYTNTKLLLIVVKKGNLLTVNFTFHLIFE